MQLDVDNGLDIGGNNLITEIVNSGKTTDPNSEGKWVSYTYQLPNLPYNIDLSQADLWIQNNTVNSECAKVKRHLEFERSRSPTFEHNYLIK